jgi:hypothetical protein
LDRPLTACALCTDLPASNSKLRLILQDIERFSI